MTRHMRGIMAALMRMTWLFIGAIVLFLIAEFFVNKYRDTSHWTDYHIVRPIRQEPFTQDSPPRVYFVGQRPVFYTRAEWYQDMVTAAWPDVIWCAMLEGPDKGLTIRFSPNSGQTRYPKGPGKVGYYVNGVLVAGSRPGYWKWDGEIPEYPALCTLDPNPVLYPSPGVERHVAVPPTEYFEFVWPPAGSED